MSFFSAALDDVKGLEEDLLGPDYPYYKFIKAPGEMGMGSGGSLKTLKNDIVGLVGYVQLLVSGGGSASKVSGPLGNKFFLQTGAKCTDTETSKSVDRTIYINHQPDGSIPFISSGMGVNFTEFEGLVPGTLSNLSNINPFSIFQSFMSGSNPDCQAITMETIDANNNASQDTQYVTTVDINSMNPCWFPKKSGSRKNPVSGVKCSESFANLRPKVDYSKMPDNTFVKVYYSILGLLGLYLLLKLFDNKKVK